MQQSNRLPSTLSRLATSMLALSVLMTPLLFVPEVEGQGQWVCIEPAPCVEANNAGTRNTNCQWSRDSCPEATVFRCTTPPGSQNRNCERLASSDVWQVCIQYGCYDTITFVCIGDLLNCPDNSAICVDTTGCAADHACVSLGPCTSYPTLSVVVGASSTNPSVSVCTRSPAPYGCPVGVAAGTSPTNPSAVACSSLASACLGLGTTGTPPGPFAGSAYLCAPVAGCYISASPSIEGSDVGLKTCLVYTCPTTLLETDRPRASTMACVNTADPDPCLGASLDAPMGTACVERGGNVVVPRTCVAESEITAAVIDSDRDGYSNQDEVMGNSDPTDVNSDPEQDDDCDLKKNSEERDFLAAKGQGHPVLRTSSPGYTIDPNLNHPTASVTTPDVFIDWEEGSGCN